MFNNVFSCFVCNIQDKIPKAKFEMKNFSTTNNKEYQAVVLYNNLLKIVGKVGFDKSFLYILSDTYDVCYSIFLEET